MPLPGTLSSLEAWAGGSSGELQARCLPPLPSASFAARGESLLQGNVSSTCPQPSSCTGGLQYS